MHAPLTQASLPEHAFAHAPQFILSVCGSTQASPQSTRSLAHTSESTTGTSSGPPTSSGVSIGAAASAAASIGVTTSIVVSVGGALSSAASIAVRASGVVSIGVAPSAGASAGDGASDIATSGAESVGGVGTAPVPQPPPRTAVTARIPKRIIAVLSLATRGCRFIGHIRGYSMAWDSGGGRWRVAFRAGTCLSEATSAERFGGMR